MVRASSVALLASSAITASAHMGIFDRSVYGMGDILVGKLWTDDYTVPMIGRELNNWWMRGLSDAPTAGTIKELPAGGKITFEIACNLLWTSLGWLSGGINTTTTPGSWLDACPGNIGAFHGGDGVIDQNIVSGCALAIADVDDIHKVTQTNQVVFSTNQSCVSTKLTDFAIPADMPACTGTKCICSWYWLTNVGQANYYQTAFDCKVTNVSPTAKKIGAPVRATWAGQPGVDLKVARNNTVGPKMPFYLYNNGVEPAAAVVQVSNAYRPGYHASWSFPINGAQIDIFTSELANPAASNSSASASIVPVPSTSVVQAAPNVLLPIIDSSTTPAVDPSPTTSVDPVPTPVDPTTIAAAVTTTPTRRHRWQPRSSKALKMAASTASSPLQSSSALRSHSPLRIFRLLAKFGV